MTPEEALAEAAGRLRQAVTAGAYREAGQRVEDLRGAFDRALSSLPPHHPEVLRLSGEACELIGWARSVLLCDRSQIAARLEELKRAAPYKARRVRRRRTWEMQG